MKSILVLSPHPDDAILSCTEHMLDWKKKKYGITVCTIFSQAMYKKISRDANQFVIQSGFNDIYLFNKARNAEENKALELLNVRYINLKYSDAIFRMFRNRILYPNFNSVFGGKIVKQDEFTKTKLIRDLSLLTPHYDYVVIPTGIGNHVDHVLVHYCATKTIPSTKQIHYLDIPYVFKLKNWKTSVFPNIISGGLSIKFASKYKRKVLQCYPSQKILINTEIRYFPELIMLDGKKL